MNALQFIVQRYSDNGNSTLGLWLERKFRHVEFLAYALEDEYRPEKLPGETRIPADWYELRLREYLTPLTVKYRQLYPAFFEWHIEVIGVRGFTNVYVHVGNDEADTDACVLMGDSANNNQVKRGRILESAAAYERWYRRVHPHLKAGGRAFLEVRDEHFLRAGR